MSAPAIPTIPATVDAGNTIVPGSTQVVLSSPGTDLGTLFATFLSSLPNNTVLPGYVAADGTVPIGTGTSTVMVDTASSARTGNARWYHLVQCYLDLPLRLRLRALPT